MIRRALLLLAIAGIYMLVVRKRQKSSQSTEVDHAAEAQWANEGGGNAPTTV